MPLTILSATDHILEEVHDPLAEKVAEALVKMYVSGQHWHLARAARGVPWGGATSASHLNTLNLCHKLVKSDSPRKITVF